MNEESPTEARPGSSDSNRGMTQFDGCGHGVFPITDVLKLLQKSTSKAGQKLFSTAPLIMPHMIRILGLKDSRHWVWRHR